MVENSPLEATSSTLEHLEASLYSDVYTDLGSELVAVIFAGSTILESNWDFQQDLSGFLDGLLDHYLPRPIHGKATSTNVASIYLEGLAEQA